MNQKNEPDTESQEKCELYDPDTESQEEADNLYVYYYRQSTKVIFDKLPRPR